SGRQVSETECVYYVIGTVSVLLAWYFNVRYVSQHSIGWDNPLWGEGGWANYVKLMFANPAAGAVSQGYLIASLVLLPLFTIVDGYRRAVRRPWLYFVLSWFFPFVFAWAFYLATVDRQRRLIVHDSLGPANGSAPGRRAGKQFRTE